jgi:hypothetical protein
MRTASLQTISGRIVSVGQVETLSGRLQTQPTDPKFDYLSLLALLEHENSAVLAF